MNFSLTSTVTPGIGMGINCRLIGFLSYSQSIQFQIHIV